MRKPELLRRLRLARDVVMSEISGNRRGKDGTGLASEGYAGGYRDALNDVEAVLTHGCPADHRRYWRLTE